MTDNWEIISVPNDKQVWTPPDPHTLTIERLDTSLPMPTYAHEGDSGFDLYVSQGMVIEKHGTEVYPTGIKCVIPEGYELQIRPRSSMSKVGLLAHFGTVDAGYRGEIMVTLTELHGKTDGCINKGTRIAQAVLAPVTRAHIVEGVVACDTERGEGGFGSTGK